MRQFTIQRVMLVTLFALIFAMATRIPVDTDTWWHLRSGDYTLNEGFIYEDPFSHTRQGEAWINHSWGAQIVMYGMHELLGDAGLTLYTAVLATAGMAMLYPVCAGNVYLRAFALVLGAATAAVFWSARPQMASFFLSAVVFYLLYRYKREEVDWLWFLVPVMWLWANLHAGWSIGFIFIAGFIGGEVLGHLFAPADERRVPWRGLRKLALVAVIAAAVMVVNPYGPRLLTVPFDTVGIGALRGFIQEWNSPNFQGRETWPFIALLFGLLAAAGMSRLRLDWADFALVAGTAFMALLYGRNIAVFAVPATVALTYYVDDILQERGWVLRPVTRMSQTQVRLNVALTAFVLLGVFAYFVSVITPATVDEAQRAFLPVDAAEHIAANQPTGPMFNSYNWGGYLLYALPDYPVYVDGRTDLYRDDLLSRYLQAALAQPGWRDILDEDGIRLVVVESGSGLATALREEVGWSLDYEDDRAVIFSRDEV